MSDQHVELARRGLAAFNRTFADGTEDLYEHLAPDIEWIPITAVLDGQTHRGHDGVR